jgi:hypothetical protein
MKKLAVITLVALFSIVMFTGVSFADPNANANAGANSGSDASINDSFNSSNQRGGHLIDPGFQYGPVINYFGQPLPSDGFQPVESLLIYSTWFTVGTLETIVDGDGDAEAEFMAINKEVQAPGLYRMKGKEKIQWIKVIVSKEPVAGAYDIGFVVARSDDRRTGMPKVMAAAALKAAKAGCNVIQFIAQGAVRDAFSTGWGIGINTSYGKISGGSDNDEAIVGGGGLGYSSAQAGMRDKPWLQAHGLWVTGLVAPEFSKPVPEVQALIDADNAAQAAKAKAKADAKIVKTVEKKPAPEKVTASAKEAPVQTGNHISKGS